MKRIDLHYVAMLRESAGKATESISTSSPDVATLFEEIAGRHAWPWPRHAFRPAVNDRVVDWQHPVEHGDRVLFLPPSSGG